MPISIKNPLSFKSLEKKAQVQYDASKVTRCSDTSFRMVETYYAGWAIVESGKWGSKKQQLKWVCVHNGINPELSIRADKHSMVVEKCIRLNESVSFQYESGNTISLKSGRSSQRLRLRYASDILAQNWLDLIHQSISHGLWLKNVKVINQVGEGSFSKVMMCHHQDSGHKFALKVVDGSIDGNTEIAILLKLHQLCIVEPVVDIIKVFENQNRTCIMMPLYTGKTLYDIVTAKKALPEDCASQHIRAIAHDLREIHAHGIVHCDLKLENIMFTREGKLRIIDFGGALDLKHVTNENACGLVGTPGYISPERLNGKAALPPSDIFSLGVIMYQALTGRHPFSVKGQSIAIRSTLNVDRKLESKHWTHISEEAKDLVRRMLDPNPESRITANQIMHHPWLADMPLLSTCA